MIKTFPSERHSESTLSEALLSIRILSSKAFRTRQNNLLQFKRCLYGIFRSHFSFTQSFTVCTNRERNLGLSLFDSQEDVGTKQINLHLFRLFHQERESHECAEDLEKRNAQLAEVNKKKERIENELREKKKDVSYDRLISFSELKQKIFSMSCITNSSSPSFRLAKPNASWPKSNRLSEMPMSNSTNGNRHTSERRRRLLILRRN